MYHEFPVIKSNQDSNLYVLFYGNRKRWTPLTFQVPNFSTALWTIPWISSTLWSPRRSVKIVSSILIAWPRKQTIADSRMSKWVRKVTQKHITKCPMEYKWKTLKYYMHSRYQICCHLCTKTLNLISLDEVLFWHCSFIIFFSFWKSIYGILCVFLLRHCTYHTTKWQIYLSSYNKSWNMLQTDTVLHSRNLIGWWGYLLF